MLGRLAEAPSGSGITKIAIILETISCVGFTKGFTTLTLEQSQRVVAAIRFGNFVKSSNKAPTDRNKLHSLLSLCLGFSQSMRASIFNGHGPKSIAHIHQGTAVVVGALPHGAFSK